MNCTFARTCAALIVTFGSLLGLPGTMRAASFQHSTTAAHAVDGHGSDCPSKDALFEALRTASEWMASGQYANVVASLSTLNEKGCDPRVALLLAAAYEGNGQLPQATETLEKAHQLWPANDHVAASLARLYFGTSQMTKAADALKTFQARETTPAQEIEVAVVVYIGTHQLQKAEDAARIGYSTYPSLQSILLLANTLQLEGRYKDVIALLEAKRSTYADKASFLVTLAQSEYDASMFDVARSNAEHAIALNPKLYAAHYLLANVLEKTGMIDGAVQEYRTAIQLSPDQPRTYYYLALALRSQQKQNEEEEVLAKALAVDAHYALARCELGRILLSQDRIPQAITQLNLAVEENASNEQSYLLLAKAYERAGDKTQAEAMAKRYAEVSKANHTSQHGSGPPSPMQ